MKKAFMTPGIHIKAVTPYLRHMQTRMPFRFGNTVMTGMPVLHLRVEMEASTGELFEGWSGCGLVSMWFDKDYSKSETQRESDLLCSVGEAIKAYLRAGKGSAWELHEKAEKQARKALMGAGFNGLVSGYGVALLDAAVVDGICRFSGMSFYNALKVNLLGLPFDLSSVLPDKPTANMAIRHTIGLGDPLIADDLKQSIGDGLPETLDLVVDRYGVRYFKIKVNNNIVESLERLERITRLLDQKQVDYAATLDGNEAFTDMESFGEFVWQLRDNQAIAPLWKRILFIEQPVARQRALELEVNEVLRQITKLKPVIIDESDDSNLALQQALDVGYSGISAKNCKSLYRSIHSFYSVASKETDVKLILSSEDLTNQPILPNHQDLCVVAALGITHSERNGHHFFQGFRFLPEHEQVQSLRDYPSLYEMGEHGIPSLRISNGSIDLNEVNNAHGLGVVSPPDWETMRLIKLTVTTDNSAL